MRLAEKLLHEMSSETGGPYPELKTPVPIEKVRELYQYFNRKYFDSELPEITIRYSPLTKRFWGKAEVRVETKEIIISLSPYAENNGIELVNTLLHEMIHVWQYHKYLTTGEKKYLDRDAGLRDVSGYNKKGHKVWFHLKMKALRDAGFNVEIESKLPDTLLMSKERYVYVFKVQGSFAVFVSDADFTHDTDGILGDIESRVGHAEWVKVYRTNHRYSQLAVKLTSTGRIPKNVKNILFVPKFYDALESTGSPVFEKEFNEYSGVNASLIRAVNSQSPDKKSNDMHSYIRNVLYSYNRYSRVKFTGNEKSLEDYPESIPMEVLEYIASKWKALTWEEAKKFSEIKHWIYEQHRRLRYGNKLDDKEQAEFVYRYAHLEGRISREDFYGFLRKTLLGLAKRDESGYAKENPESAVRYLDGWLR